MSNNGDIYLGTLSSETYLQPFGRKLTIKKKETARKERTFDGTLKWDTIYKKHTFILKYKLIDGDEVAVLEGLYDLEQPLSLKLFTDVGVSDDYTVYMNPIDKTRVITVGTGLWSGVSVVLEEE